MEVFNLDLRPGRANPVLHCSQFDEGRAYRANLFEGASVYTLDGTETITLIEKKLDGNEVTIGVTNTSDSYVEFSTTQQLTALAGSQLCELRFEKGADLIGSANFILDCEESPDTGIASDSAIHNLEEQIAEAVADQYDSNNVIFDNAPTPGHGVGYCVTSEGTPDELADLTDVELTAPAIGEALVYDGTKFVNGTVSTVGSIDDLNDVDTTGKAEGDSLRYDSGSSEWVAKPIVIEVTQAEYDQLVLDGDLQPLTTYVLTDAPNLNATSEDLSYDGGATSTHDAIGTLSSLNTTNKSSLVSAVNEVFDKFAYLSKMCTKITLGANATKTITVTQDSASRVGFIVYGVGAQGTIAPIMYLVGGYVTASRCSVINISGKTGITIDASSTSNLNFGFTNTTAISTELFFLPLFDNTFT